MLHGKNILLCVTGGIAVFKAAALTSKLSQAGADVKVMMTSSATKFVQPLTFQVLSGNEVYIDTFIENQPEVIAHIDVADWADLIIVAPATANIIGKIANGIADNMIVTSLLAATAPVWIAPAMNLHMYEHPAVSRNIAQVIEDGYRLIEPDEGFLACGHVGKGRLEEPEAIVKHIEQYFTYKNKKNTFINKKIVVTAGPTREKVDPVRFFSNYSSGKMGYAIAEEAASYGADVTLISGPTNLQKPIGVKLLEVESAKQMYEATLEEFKEADVVIKAAAVADYRPSETYSQKLKKSPGNLNMELERTKDILGELGRQKTTQLLVGFAAETDNLIENARKKLREKNADIIVANDITEAGAGFAVDTNKVTIISRNIDPIQLPQMDKREVARRLLAEIEKAQQLKDES